MAGQHHNIIVAFSVNTVQMVMSLSWVTD